MKIDNNMYGSTNGDGVATARIEPYWNEADDEGCYQCTRITIDITVPTEWADRISENKARFLERLSEFVLEE